MIVTLFVVLVGDCHLPGATETCKEPEVVLSVGMASILQCETFRKGLPEVIRQRGITEEIGVFCVVEDGDEL